MKFLVLWRLELGRLSAEVMRAVLRMPEYGDPLLEQGKVLARYHIVGGHGGAWIYQVETNEELELLLAQSPVYNFARYRIYPLADMTAPPVAAPEQP